MRGGDGCLSTGTLGAHGVEQSMHVGNKIEEGSFQLHRTAMGENSAVRAVANTLHIFNKENKIRKEKKKDVKKESSGTFRAERYSIGNKKHTG